MFLFSGKESYCTAPNEFLCKNNACINESLTCNAEDDCGDFSGRLSVFKKCKLTSILNSK
jgi:hypothetical protein